MTQPPSDAPLRPFDARMLSAGDGHWIYVEEVGKRDGVPALFLHGGPGSGAQHHHRALFDPARFHAVLIDQRGAGRSHPYLSTRANTTAHLVADIELIRAHLGIDRWYLVGGSWGSTLALAYAERFPERVLGLVLRAVFLATRAEVDWAFLEGPRRFRPELYEAFLAFLPQAERADPLAAYLARIRNPDPAVHAPAAHVWHAYERALSELAPAAAKLPVGSEAPARTPPTPIMEAHYIVNNFFLPDGAILDNAHRLGSIPGVVVQGRYDLLCPPRAAFALARVWPQCRIEMMERAGHAMSETGVEEAMRRALIELADAALGCSAKVG